MLIQKNTSTKSVYLYPSSKLVAPDQTVKSNGLLYDQLDLIGQEFTNYNDYQQPVIKSYTVDVTTGGITNIYEVLSQITLIEHREAGRVNVVMTDGTSLVTPPLDTVKIYTNIFDSTELIGTSPPFSYLLSSSFSFNNIKNQLYSIQIDNTTGGTLKAFVQVTRFNENDSNFNCNVDFSEPVTP